MTEPTHPSPSFDPHGERIRFEQIDALYRNVAIGVLGALAVANSKLRATLGNVMSQRQRAEAE